MPIIKSVVASIAVVGLAVAVIVPQSVRGAAQTPPSAPVTVVNTAANPVPVTGALNVGGTVLAQQSGPWTVGLTDTPLTVAPVAPITGGGQFFFVHGGEGVFDLGSGNAVTASALSIALTGGAHDFVLFFEGRIVARFPGFGNDSINLALTRPISFDKATCGGAAAGVCYIGWIGNEP